MEIELLLCSNPRPKKCLKPERNQGNYPETHEAVDLYDTRLLASLEDDEEIN